ncbi:MAG: hypothetical protein Q9164_003173 [Protoblastenia rupestris]
MNGNAERPPLKWSTQLIVLSATATPSLKGDKIILPPSALEQLLSAATVTITNDARPPDSSFDPYNPYSFAAERHAREQLVERHQNLPHPLTFRLVNPENGRIVYAGIREFSAEGGAVGLSPFLRETLGIDKSIGKRKDSESTLRTLTIHVEELPKGTFVKLRPLEAGYDAEDWKALLEQYLRDTFTTLTNGEEIAIPAGKELFRFLVDGLKPSGEAVSLVDTDLEVDIEPLSEEQARETLSKLANKSLKAPGTKNGSSAGGKIEVGSNEAGQIRPLEYVDYMLDQWDPKQDLVLELRSLDDENDLDIFASPFSQRHRSKPREDSYVFGNLSCRATKRIKIHHTNAEMDNAEALWVSVRGCADPRKPLEQATPIQYNLSVSSVNSYIPEQDVSMVDAETLTFDEERCSNCHQAIPKRTMFLHENFCLRNNILCPHCKNVFQKASEAWRDHWHCPQDDDYGNTSSSKIKHDKLMHASRPCPSCDYEAANTPDLAQHRTTTCPGKLILCQFCHLQIPQQGPDDPSPHSAEVILSGLTPHELSDGARTTECHLCYKIVRLRDMSSHLKHHDLQRLSRAKPRICRNVNCGHTLDGVSKTGEVKHQAPRNDLGLCNTCFGPLYVSQYDPDGKALRRRVERKYLSQLLTGCQQPWCRNEYCKTGRKHLGLEEEGKTMTSKDAMWLIKPSLENLMNQKTPLQICTDETSQRRRVLADMVAAEKGNGGSTTKGKGKGKEGMDHGYELEWCIAALEVEGGDLDKARGWLKGFAPTRGETAN